MASDRHTRSTAGVHIVRFGVAIAILVAVSLAGVALEQRSLELSRQYSLQTFRADRLEQEAAELRLRIEDLKTPQRLMEAQQNATETRRAATDAAGRVTR
ncbi:MAG TPA: hypothetical protein VM510_06040 [Caulifigura sp.]|jgi:hypothetical protein|nr:hypothetical protein [Caulifigura sp.]